MFHASLLEPYQENQLPNRAQAIPLPVEVEGEMEYEVKRILDSRIDRGRLTYLVDWVGYGPEERTWEPAENVEHAPEAVEIFHREYPLRPAPQDIRSTDTSVRQRHTRRRP